MASELPPSPARTTTTLYSYAEKLAAEQAPRSASLLLGLRWCFGLPAPAPAALTALTEYSLPLNPLPVERALAERGGLRLVRHAGDDEAALADHLAAGKPAIVAVDAFYFSFRPAFRRVHSSRTVLVRRTGESLRLADGWLPAVETTVGRAELAAARRSSVPLDVEREPLFSGNPVGGVWFSLEVDPLEVRDAAGWMRARLACLHAEMTRARRDERGEYGLPALRAFQRRLERGLLEANPETNVAWRRGGSLLLRPELSSRLYLGVFLRNAAHRLGDPALQRAVEEYRRRLGHWQAAMDVLTKTVRLRRPEYDAFIRAHLARACDNEERLAAALAGYAPASAGTSPESA